MVKQSKDDRISHQNTLAELPRRFLFARMGPNDRLRMDSKMTSVLQPVTGQSLFQSRGFKPCSVGGKMRPLYLRASCVESGGDLKHLVFTVWEPMGKWDWGARAQHNNGQGMLKSNFQTLCACHPNRYIEGSPHWLLKYRQCLSKMRNCM